MKYKIFVLIIGIMLISPIAGSAIPSAELIDGSFENWDGNTLLDWEYIAEGTLERVPGRTDSCPKFTMDSDNEYSQLSAFLGDVSPGHLLFFSVYANGNDSNSLIVFYINFGKDDGTIGNNVVDTEYITPYTWTKLDVPGLYAPSGTINATIKIGFTYDGSEGTYHEDYVDDCVISGSAVNELSNTLILVFSSSFVIASVVTIRKKRD